MLSNYLDDAISDIERLIQTTKKDIEDIKQAKHDDMFERVRLKNDLIVSFGAKKTLLDNELVLLTNQNENKELSEILTDEQNQKLELLKTSLVELHDLNKQYARFVVTISEFYNSLLESMFPSESDGYNRAAAKPASFLKVRV